MVKMCYTFFRLLIFFEINFFEQFYHEHRQSVKQFGSRSGPTFVGPDVGQIFVQWLPAEDIH